MNYFMNRVILGFAFILIVTMAVAIVNAPVLYFLVMGDPISKVLFAASAQYLVYGIIAASITTDFKVEIKRL